MADNFNLRSFLTENKLTKNAKLLKEEQEGYRYFEEEGNGGYYLDTVDGHKIYSMEDSSVMDTCFYAIIDPDGNEEFVGIDVAGEPISSEELQNEYELQSNIADFIEADINAELGDGLDENKVDEARYSDSYDTPAAKAVNAKAQQIVGTITGYKTALQTIQDAIKQVEQEVGSEVTRSEKSTLESHLMHMFRSNAEMERESVGIDDEEQANDIEQAQHDMERRIDAQVENALQESRLTTKERRLVEMVQAALDTEGYGDDNVNLQRKKQGLPPVQGPKYSEAVSEEEGNVDYTMGNQDDPNQLPNPPEELHIPTYKTIEELMSSIEHGTNEAAHTYKMNRMKEVAEALETKVGSLEEGEHAEHIDQKAVKQMRKDIASLRKAEEKLRKEFEKKFNKKDKSAAAPKAEAEKPTLQEGFFDLRKFLAENRK